VYAGPGLLKPGAQRVAALRRFAGLGLSRTILDLDPAAIHSPDYLNALAQDVQDAGFALEPA
jgi:hypothetical protein